MFCEKCGTKNDDNAKFCEKCGSILSNESYVKDSENYCSSNSEIKYTNQIKKETFIAPTFDEKFSEEYVQTQRKPMDAKTRFIVIASIVALALLIFLYVLGGKITNPKKTAEKYFNSISCGDYEAAFDYLDVPKGNFTTKKLFVQTSKENYADFVNNEIVNYKIKEAFSENGLIKVYNIEYTQKGDSSQKTFQISLMKQSGKKWLLYDEYKISDQSILAQNYKIYAPPGSKVFIDNNEVPSSFRDNDVTEGECYVIKNIFSGKHLLKATAPYMEETSMEEVIESGGECMFSDLKISKSAINEISQCAQNAVQQVYNSGIAGKDYTAVSKLFTKDNSELKSGYKSFCESINDDYSKLVEISFSNFSIDGELNVSDKITFNANVDMNYKCTYTSKDIFTDENEPYNDEDSTTLLLNFVYENGKWLINNFDFYIYY